MAGKEKMKSGSVSEGIYDIMCQSNDAKLSGRESLGMKDFVSAHSSISSQISANSLITMLPGTHPGKQGPVKSWGRGGIRGSTHACKDR
jgi:hypothetical protein